MFFMLLFVIFTNYTGKSCHNQRIERLWRDVFGGCIVLFYELFSNLERCGILDPNDDIQLWCLHHVFIPVINCHLTNWKNAWMHHPLRTERNATPMQLWITGLQRLWGTGSPVGREVFEEDISNYGIDWQGPVPPPSAVDVFVRTVECVTELLRSPVHS